MLPFICVNQTTKIARRCSKIGTVSFLSYKIRSPKIQVQVQDAQSLETLRVFLSKQYWARSAAYLRHSWISLSITWTMTLHAKDFWIFSFGAKDTYRQTLNWFQAQFSIGSKRSNRFTCRTARINTSWHETPPSPRPSNEVINFDFVCRQRTYVTHCERWLSCIGIGLAQWRRQIFFLAFIY